jgi:hypothetical protein
MIFHSVYDLLYLWYVKSTVELRMRLKWGGICWSEFGGMGNLNDQWTTKDLSIAVRN